MATKVKKNKPEDQSGENKSANGHYQEWDVKINAKQDKDGKTIHEAEKLKVSRPCVKITDEQAEILNHGVLTGGNSYAKMYYKEEAE